MKKSESGRLDEGSGLRRLSEKAYKKSTRYRQKAKVNMQKKDSHVRCGKRCPLRDLSPCWRSDLSDCCQTGLNPPMAVFVKPVRCAAVRQRVREGGTCSGSTRAVFGAAIKAARGRYKRGRQTAIFREKRTCEIVFEPLSPTATDKEGLHPLLTADVFLPARR